MASTKKLYNQALTRWDRLREERQFSLPDDEGTVAILVPYWRGWLENPATQKSTNALDVLVAMGEESQKRLTAAGRPTRLLLQARPADFRDVIQDRTVSSIEVTGMGNLAAIEVDSGMPGLSKDSRTFLDWSNLSQMTTHLKQGRYFTRSCGELTRDFNAPTGTFVVSSHAHVLAPVGRSIFPTDLDDVYNDFVQPVTTEDRMDYEYIKETFAPTRTHSIPLPDSAYRAVRGLRNHLLHIPPTPGSETGVAVPLEPIDPPRQSSD